MNVVHVIESTATGTLSIAQMAANSQVRDSDTTVIFSRRSDTPENIETIFEKDVRLVEEDLQARKFPFSVFSLRRHLKSIKPDCVHCHSSFAGFVGRLATLGLKTKVFYSPHCISFMREDIGKGKALLFRLFELVACVKQATYVACSNSEKEAIQQALPFVKVALLENAVDLSEFRGCQKQAIEVSSNEIVKVITVGGIRPQKGPEEFAYIASQFKNSNVEFIWIGDGEPEFKRVLIDAGVNVKGWMPREKVIEELYKAELYISTALWEGMPVSVIEACAADIPVILRDCAGNRDIVSHGKDGHLFSETSQCIEFLNQYLEQPEHFEQLAGVAYKQVFERFSVERFSKELDEIYKK
ncbi:glycosyltransferase [Vibrio profundum]|uniref:glycosyltransferase n=1 Tax=Vibrio profundum TaxID=2910247 RepID=UPI003D0B3D58